MKISEVMKTSIIGLIIFTVILLIVTTSIYFVIPSDIWSKFLLNKRTVNIATIIGGVSALIVQSASVILLFFTLKKQSENNNEQQKYYVEQKKMNDSNIKLNNKQMEKLEFDIKSSTTRRLVFYYKQLTQEFRTKSIEGKLINCSFLEIKESIKNSDNKKKEVLYYLNSFLSSVLEYIDDVENEDIEKDTKKSLIKKIKLFIETDFDKNVYKHIDNDWKNICNLGQSYNKVETLVQKLVS